jgi:hypothetical protein
MMHSGKPKTRHYVGLPPEIAPGAFMSDLPQARFIVLQTADSGVFLNRYSEEGEFAGDTWHIDEDEALEQAAFEFGVKPEDWMEIHPDEDAVARGILLISARG